MKKNNDGISARTHELQSLIEKTIAQGRDEIESCRFEQGQLGSTSWITLNAEETAFTTFGLKGYDPFLYTYAEVVASALKDDDEFVGHLDFKHDRLIILAVKYLEETNLTSPNIAEWDGDTIEAMVMPLPDLAGEDGSAATSKGDALTGATEENFFVDGEFLFIPNEFLAKSRWAITSGAVPDEDGNPQKMLMMDAETRWGVRHDDPRTLCSFAEAKRILHEGRCYSVVYVADEDDDLEKVHEFNRAVCPLYDLPHVERTTYWELREHEVMLRNSDQPEPFEWPDLVPHVAYLIFQYHGEYKDIEIDAASMAQMLNLDAQVRGDLTVYTEEWVLGQVEKAFEGKNRIMIPGLLCMPVVVSKSKYLPNQPVRELEYGSYLFTQLYPQDLIDWGSSTEAA